MSSMFKALWRTLFCTITISCTLSRINAHGQRLDRIKDLMCVLFLSGMQKEDMDMSLLIKLQRYNININEIDNTELRKTCIPEIITTPSSSIATDDIKQPHYDIVSSTKHADRDSYKTNATLQNFGYITNSQEQPNIETKMKFWENLLKSKHTEAKNTEVHKTISPRTVKSNIPEKQHYSIDLNQREYGDKIISNQHRPIDKLNKPIPEKYSFNGEQIKMDHKTQPIYFNFQQPPFERNLAFKSYETVKYEENKAKIPTEQKIDDILKTINQFKSMFANIYPNKQENIRKLQDKNNANVNLTKELSFQSNHEILQSNYNDDLVKKIANSVKDMVLHDLRKEMHTTTTTTHRVSTILQNDIINDTENVMTKVLTMLQSLKMQPDSHSETKLKTNKAEYQVNLDNKPFKQIQQFTHQTYNLAPQIHKYKTDPPNSRLQFRPITFQTNSLEIPPLGIPLGYAQNPINQNIIVTTVRPFKINYESVIGPNHRDNAFMKVNPKEAIQSLSAKFSKRSDDCPFNHPCNHKNAEKRFRVDNKENPKDDRDYEKINLGRIQSHNSEPLRIPRFHEKLERADRFQLSDLNEDCCKYPITQQMFDCCNEKIASRQQTSVAQRGSYDDTHFKNFLKTQQKVTDMLQQILASKALPVSVETT